MTTTSQLDQIQADLSRTISAALSGRGPTVSWRGIAVKVCESSGNFIGAGVDCLDTFIEQFPGIAPTHENALLLVNTVGDRDTKFCEQCDDEMKEWNRREREEERCQEYEKPEAF